MSCLLDLGVRCFSRLLCATSVCTLSLPSKGEVHSKMKTSYLIVFRALSRMVKVRGACDKLFWIYRRLNNCATPTSDNDILVVAAMAGPTHKMLPSLPLNVITVRRGDSALILSLIYSKRLIACTLDLDHSTQRPEHYKM